MSYRPKIKTNTSGGLTDFPLDAETVKGVDVVNTKQNVLIDSGANQNIKTINGNSILGSGNINITATDEKARKLLGEWDTYPYNSDSSKALRETGYAIFDGSDDENWQIWDGDQYRIEVPNCFNGNGGFAISNRYPTSTNWNNQRQIGIYNAGGYTSYQLFVRDNNYNLSTFIESLKTNPLIVQYKTNTSYVDNVIPSGQILNLDSNGCQFVRDEYEKGLNLLPNSANVTLYHDVYYNFPLKKGTYTISVSNYASSGRFLVVGAVSGSSSVSVLANLVNTNGVATFTITQDNYTLQRFYVENSTTTNIMLNKGSHAYPYQDFYGKIMHEKDVQAIQGAIAYTDRNNYFTSKQNITSSTEDTPLRLKGNSNSVCDIQFVGANDTALSWLSAHNDGHLYEYSNSAYHRLALNEDKVDHSINLDTGVDLNTVTTSGFYRINGSPQNGFPGADWSQMIVSSGADTIAQIGIPYSKSEMYVRSGNPSDVGGSGNWNSWKKVAMLDDLPHLYEHQISIIFSETIKFEGYLLYTFFSTDATQITKDNIISKCRWMYGVCSDGDGFYHSGDGVIPQYVYISNDLTINIVYVINGQIFSEDDAPSSHWRVNDSVREV